MYKIACLAALCLCMAKTCLSQGLKNDIKVNLSSLALKNFSLQYERGLTKHIAVALGVRYMPKGNIPFQQQVVKLVKNGDFDFNALQVGNTAITPEVRFYMGRGRQSGFYIAPYARYANFNLDVPINYQATSGNTEAVFTGSVNSFSGGVMFGVQHVIAKRIVLDIWIIGAHYGSCSGSAVYTAAQPLSQPDQQSLQQKINDTNLKFFNFSGTVNANGGTIQTNGSWAGVRGAGINLGIRF
jgi:hypothetical protein